MNDTRRDSWRRSVSRRALLQRTATATTLAVATGTLPAGAAARGAPAAARGALHAAGRAGPALCPARLPSGGRRPTIHGFVLTGENLSGEGPVLADWSKITIAQ
jgi:hypothetical protein